MLIVFRSLRVGGRELGIHSVNECEDEKVQLLVIGKKVK